MNEGERFTMTLLCRQMPMKVRLILAISMLVTAGCTKPADAPPPFTPVPAPPSPIASIVPQAPIEQPAEPVLGEQDEAVGPVPPEKVVLEGSSWRVGAFTYTFQKGGHAIVSGGHLNKLARSGAPGRYIVRGDDITIIVMGRRYKARREGGNLFIGDRKAVRIDQGNVDTDP